MPINFSQISVVIQGQIYSEYTFQTCESIRKFLPEAEIVLSTWKGENIENLDYDILVLNDDPGANIDNVNRQIVSTLNGIKAATKDYVLKIRSESRITGLRFIEEYAKYTRHGQEYVFLNNRIVIQGVRPARNRDYFHILDWYFFGSKADMLDFWDVPLYEDGIEGTPELYYNAHRYLITAFVKKHIQLQFNDYSDINKKNALLHDKIVAENFIVLGQRAYGIESLKYPYQNDWTSMRWYYYYNMTFNEWKKLYNKFSGGREMIRIGIRELYEINIWEKLYSLYRFCKSIPEMIKHLLGKIRN